jgi:hypothetical protein
VLEAVSCSALWEIHRPEPVPQDDDTAVSIRERLNGDDPRAFRNVDTVVDLVLAELERLDELNDCILEAWTTTCARGPATPSNCTRTPRCS